MMNQPNSEAQAQSVDIKEYLAVLLKRKWLVLVCFLLSMAAATAFLFTRQPIYRANAKLLVASAGRDLPGAEVQREDDRTFFGTQIDVMTGQPMLRRVQQRMKKTPEEIRENLTNLKIDTVRGATIILISVDSPSKDFAREFANTLADEYLKWRDEQRAGAAETSLLQLTREISRLSTELKASNDRILNYAKQHNIADISGAQSEWQQRYTLNAQAYSAAAAQLAATKARKQLLDTRPDASSVIALLASEQTNPSFPTPNNTSTNATPLKAGSILSIAVKTDPSLNRRVVVNPNGTVDYPPLGTIALAGLLPEAASAKIEQELIRADLLKPAIPDPTATLPTTANVVVQLEGDLSSNTVQALAGFTETVSIPSPVTRGTLGALDENEAQRIFNLERKRQELQTRITALRKEFKPKHPVLIAAEKELYDISSQVDGTVQFYRQKAEADMLVAQRRYDEVLAASKKLEEDAVAESTKNFELDGLKEDAARIRSLYNTLLGQLMRIDVTQGFRTRIVSVLEQAILEADPVYPKKVKGLMVAAFFGLGLGLALAFFIEYIDDSIKLAEDVERDLQLPFMGMIPAAQWSPDDLTAHRLDRLKQQGGVSESYRVVRSAIIFSTPREKLRSILLASAVPREGKTTTCVNLAIGFAQIEERVLLMDGDLRRGEIHKFFDLEREKGMADVLLGEATPEEVIKPSGVPKLDVMTCGAYPSNPAELLLGWRLKELLDWAGKHYDRIVIDGPPVMGIADSAILGSLTDGVLFVIWAGRTSRRYVRVAKATAVSRGAKLFGFVLNNLEPGRVGYYHYYPYYYSYYSRGYYYAHAEEDKGKGGDIKGAPVTREDGKQDIDDVY